MRGVRVRSKRIQLKCWHDGWWKTACAVMWWQLRYRRQEVNHPLTSTGKANPLVCVTVVRVSLLGLIQFLTFSEGHTASCHSWKSLGNFTCDFWVCFFWVFLFLPLSLFWRGRGSLRERWCHKVLCDDPSLAASKSRTDDCCQHHQYQIKPTHTVLIKQSS